MDVFHQAGTPRIIALMNQKGGVGKTTTTVNLAAALAKQGYRTLLVDLDPQAHATLHLGIDPAALDGSIYDVLHEPETEVHRAVLESRQNLWVLPAETDLAGVENDLRDAPDRNQRLQKALNAVRDRFDVVILDCPPALGLLTLNALTASDSVLIPMQAHYLALQGVSKLLETVQLVRQSLNASLNVEGVILCMHEMQTTLAQEVVADLEDFFEAAKGTDVPWASARLLRPAIRRNIKLAECPSFGQTIFEYAPSAAGAADYEALARNLTGAPEPTPEPERTPEPKAEPKPESASTPSTQAVETKPEAQPEPERMPNLGSQAQVEHKPQIEQPSRTPSQPGSSPASPGSWIDDSPYGYPT